jgi:prevent-host-death family protein
MESVNIYEAKTHLSRLVARAEAGEETVVTRNGRPVARLVPLTVRTARRVPGAWKGRIEIADDFDDFGDDDERDWFGS